MGEGKDWLRVRGIGRERFAGYISSYLETSGFAVVREESTEPSESRISAKLSKMNPSVPAGGSEISFRVYPTSGGAAVEWIRPDQMPGGDRSRMDRFVREFVQHLERAILTESHATAKVSRAPNAQLPWETAG